MNQNHNERVDKLISHLWSKGYLTLSRKYGKYLPEPSNIGDYEIDAFMQYKKSKYAIGLTLTEEDLESSDLTKKLIYLASRQTRFGKKNITLFIGVPSKYLFKLNSILKELPSEIRKNIEFFELSSATIN